MAIDTRNKRMSLIGFGNPYKRMLPNPDGSFANKSDRQQLEYLYAGVMAASSITLFDGLTTSMRLTGVGH